MVSPPYFSELLGPRLTMNLAQLVSPSVALPAELVSEYDVILVQRRSHEKILSRKKWAVQLKTVKDLVRTS